MWGLVTQLDLIFASSNATEGMSCVTEDSTVSARSLFLLLREALMQHVE